MKRAARMRGVGSETLLGNRAKRASCYEGSASQGLWARGITLPTHPATSTDAAKL